MCLIIRHPEASATNTTSGVRSGDQTDIQSFDQHPAGSKDLLYVPGHIWVELASLLVGPAQISSEAGRILMNLRGNTSSPSGAESAQALFWSHQPVWRAEKRHSPASREVSLNWAVCHGAAQLWGTNARDAFHHT